MRGMGETETTIAAGFLLYNIFKSDVLDCNDRTCNTRIESETRNRSISIREQKEKTKPIARTDGWRSLPRHDLKTNDFKGGRSKQG